MILQIWSFDPGLTTGWRQINVFDGEIGNSDGGQADHFQIGNFLSESQVLRQAARNPAVDVQIVIEKFTMSPAKSQEPWSLETTGLIKYFASKYAAPVSMYRPSEWKPLIKDEVIKRSGLWIPGKRHMMDATGIALYYLVKERKMNWILSKPKDMGTKYG